MIRQAAIATTLFMAVLITASSAVARGLEDHTGEEHAPRHSANFSGLHPPQFVASTAKPFASLMNDAMIVMDDGMRRAPMNGNVEHDFITMMIPHHQGAIDMAKAVLLYSQDPALRNIALGIITEQQNEINVMRAWLQQHLDH